MITLINIVQLYPDLFTGIALPEGLDNGIVVDTIMERYGTLTPVYPEPKLFHNMILSFFQRREWNYQKLFDTLGFDYNPLENLNREDTTTDEITHTENEKNLEDNDTQTNENGNTENSVSAYNTESYNNDTKQDTTYSSTITENNSKDRGMEYEHKETHTTTSHGTIGVITNQDMIEKERNVSKFNIYDYIAEDFQSEFLIALW